VRWAYLWVPDDVIALDLDPLLNRELRRLAWAEAYAVGIHLASGTAVHRRTATLIHHLQLCIEQVRELPAHDGLAATRYADEAERFAARMRPRFPWFVHRRVAQAVQYRLVPHAIGPSTPECRVPPDHLHRAAHLRREGRLVLVPPPVSVPPPQPAAPQASEGRRS
jgi:hypothetical protein